MLFLLCGGMGASAQNEGRWYTVELLIFKRLGTEASSGEHWRTDLTLSYPDNITYLNNKADPGVKHHLGLLPAASHQLGRYYYSLKKSANYRPLLHQAWQQQMQNKANSPALIIRGGKNLGANRELEGTITLHIARYLHLHTDLWLSSEQDTQRDIYNKKQVTVLQQHRRMRSKELHYIDHPLMGILLLITPING
ncbi:MAG: peptidoglycan binding protein CsiV [Cellvibrionaceae bacterium]|nr:peptidoglycan binding protein CsiV [Cellvibrionaceae bacterium]